MMRSIIIGVAAAAVLCVATSSASAAEPCWKIAKAGEGLYKNQHCTIQGKGAAGELEGVKGRGLSVANVAKEEGCIATEKANEGNYTTLLKCEKEEGGKGLSGSFARVKFKVSCVKVGAGLGAWEDPKCTKALVGGEYLNVILPLSLPVRVGKLACLHVLTAETGRYKSESCTGSEESGGEYVEVPYNGLTGVSGAGTLKAGVDSVACSEDEDAGVITGPDSVGDLVVVFHGCKSTGSGGSLCAVKSVGASEGEIVTNELMGLFGSVKTSEASSGEGLLLLPGSGKELTTLAENACTVETSIEGQVAGEASPVGSLQTTGKLSLAVTSGKQAITDIHTLAGLVVPRLKAFGLTATEETSENLTYEEAFSIP